MHSVGDTQMQCGTAGADGEEHSLVIDLEHSGTDAAQHLGPRHDALLILASSEGTADGIHCCRCSIRRPQLDGMLNPTGCQNRQCGMALQQIACNTVIRAQLEGVRHHTAVLVLQQRLYWNV